MRTMMTTPARKINAERRPPGGTDGTTEPLSAVEVEGRSAVDVRPATLRAMPGSASWRRDQPPVDGLGFASWSCHPRAHPVEQNGSPFLTATSGRSPPQPEQRPSRRREGSARTGRWLFDAGRVLSLAVVDETVMPHLAGVVEPNAGVWPCSRILFASAPSSRAHEARRQASGLGRASGHRASYQQSTRPVGRRVGRRP